MNKKSDKDIFMIAIQPFLKARLYEKRGMTKDEYINKCRELWDKLEIDEDYEDKIIVDRLMPRSDLIKELRYDYDDKLFQEGKLDDEPDRPSLYCTAIGMYDKKGNLIRKNPDGTFKSNIDKDPLFTETREPQAMPQIIGFFDVLGFEEKLKAMGIAKMLELYEVMIKKAVLKDSWRCLGRFRVGENRYSPAIFSLPVRYSYFSDTIIFWVPLVQYFVAPFIARCAQLICEALEIEIPLRGSITIGEAVMHKKTSTYIGDPIIEAAKLEKAQNWIGVSFGRSATWPEFQKELDPKLIIQYYSAHFKPEYKNLISNLVLDWPRQWREKFRGNVIDKLNNMYKNKKYDHYYINTINFVKHSKKNSDWYKKYIKGNN